METLEFSVSERKLYDYTYMDVQKKFQRLNEKGLVNKNYTSILAMLMRYDLPFPTSASSDRDVLGDIGFVGRFFTLTLS